MFYCNKEGRGENVLRNIAGNKGGLGRGVLHNNICAIMPLYCSLFRARNLSDFFSDTDIDTSDPHPKSGPYKKQKNSPNSSSSKTSQNWNWAGGCNKWGIILCIVQKNILHNKGVFAKNSNIIIVQ